MKDLVKVHFHFKTKGEEPQGLAKKTNDQLHYPNIIISVKISVSFLLDQISVQYNLESYLTLCLCGR